MRRGKPRTLSGRLMPGRRTIELGFWLRTKRNFLLFSVLAFGVPFWCLFLWTFWDFANFADFVLITVLSLASGLAWGIGMWHFFVLKFPYMHSRKDDGDAA